MSSHTHRVLLSSTLALGALLALGACKSDSSALVSEPAPAAAASAPAAAGQPVTLSKEASATAEVVAIDAATRVVTLRRADGVLIPVKAGAEVRNFDKIAVGNSLKVRYQQTLTVARSTTLTTAQGGAVALAAGRAPKGSQPGAGAGAAVHVAVKIESIDLASNLVVFSLASGELVSHRIATPEGRTFVQGLKKGDVVELAYTEAVAVTIESM